MGITCGKLVFSPSVFNHLRILGGEIHAGRLPFVFDGGIVGCNASQKGNVSNGTQSPPKNRSTSRQRQGRRSSRRSRPSGEAQSFRSRATEEAHGDGFRLLAQHYEALGFDDEDGLWVTVKAKPLGHRGPQAHFLVGLVNDKAVAPRGWAFQSIGPQAKPFPLKHTNFTDASICAFTIESKAWVPDDGILPLVDHFVLWTVKSWHKLLFGWWPGPQVGVCGLYRREEFAPNEMCGCQSGKRYSDCHMLRDRVLSEQYARMEFHRVFGVDYYDRHYPDAIIKAAQTRWKALPKVSSLILQ